MKIGYDLTELWPWVCGLTFWPTLYTLQLFTGWPKKLYVVQHTISLESFKIKWNGFHGLRGLLPILLLGEQRHDGCEQFDSYPTASRLRFEPGPFCAWVQHANHSATEPPWMCKEMYIIEGGNGSGSRMTSWVRQCLNADELSLKQPHQFHSIQRWNVIQLQQRHGMAGTPVSVINPATPTQLLFGQPTMRRLVMNGPKNTRFESTGIAQSNG